jgi:hypothetical protein
MDDYNFISELNRGLTDFEGSFNERSVVGAGTFNLNFPA